MIFQGFKRIDEITDQNFQESYPYSKLQDHKIYAIRICQSSSKASIQLNSNWNITNFTNNLEELKIEYYKQLDLLKTDTSKHIEIIGLISESVVSNINGITSE